jgi:hypothetical protein
MNMIRELATGHHSEESTFQYADPFCCCLERSQILISFDILFDIYILNVLTWCEYVSRYSLHLYQTLTDYNYDCQMAISEKDFHIV